MKRKIELDFEVKNLKEFYNHAENVFQLERVDQVYRSTAKYNGALGASGYNGPIYGELTQHSMQKVVEIMIDRCEFSNASRFLDVGSGIAKPNLHVLQCPGVSLSIGVEVEKLRWNLAMFNLAMLFTEDSKITRVPPKLHGINIIEGNIASANSFDPFTHVYMFDIGFPPDLQLQLASIFNCSTYAEYIISYQRPRKLIVEYGYSVDLIEQESVRMHGSGQQHTAYIYRRKQSRPAVASGVATIKCDPFFTKPIEMALSRQDSFRMHCLNSAKPFLSQNAKKRQCC